MTFFASKQYAKKAGTVGIGERIIMVSNDKLRAIFQELQYGHK